MFIKKNKMEFQILEVVMFLVINLEFEVVVSKKYEIMVIVSGVYFVGNIVVSGYVYIYGQVIGNIEVKEYLIKVMCEGQVEGNVSCWELIIDGKVQGQCYGDSIIIEEYGYLEGIFVYCVLVIKKGGVFSGCVEMLVVVENKSYIFGLVVDVFFKIDVEFVRLQSV